MSLRHKLLAVLAPTAAAAGRELALVLIIVVSGVLVLTAAVLFAPDEAPVRRACRLIAVLRPVRTPAPARPSPKERPKDERASPAVAGRGRRPRATRRRSP